MDMVGEVSFTTLKKSLKRKVANKLMILVAAYAKQNTSWGKPSFHASIYEACP
jgi:hypothetical protein